jgi:hypothetical protein
MAYEDAIEMYVGGLILDPNTQAPVVVLKDELGETCLPIWIGVGEATSIASAIKQVGMARPLTHDLMFDIIGELGCTVQRVVIIELKESTYYAELVMVQGDKIFIFDSRPSDAIAMAVRTAAPIFVNRSVLDQAKITFDLNESGRKKEEEVDKNSQADGDAVSPADGGAYFNTIEKERWKEILEDLDPEDFKYKM